MKNNKMTKIIDFGDYEWSVTLKGDAATEENMAVIVEKLKALEAEISAKGQS